jgi:hypothetical protein
MQEFCADELPSDGEFLKAIATCHSLTRIDNALTGDPVRSNYEFIIFIDF